ncbi:hypothetical protein GmHk_19G053708 [Glycine max]|nr:hypothetical protein GmHk_19G053708 [Glycine max]
MFGDGCPELKWFAICVLSLTCSSFGCEQNFSSFEMVHTKRRNHLHQKKMNDLVYVMYNLKLKSRKIRKTVDLSFEDMESNDGDSTLDVFGIDNLVLIDDVGDHFSTEEELEDDGDEDDDGGGDIGDDLIRGLMDI